MPCLDVDASPNCAHNIFFSLEYEYDEVRLGYAWLYDLNA